MKFYKLQCPNFWGDLTVPLLVGEVSNYSRYEGKLIVSRTGPFVPPIMASTVLLVNNIFRAIIAEAFLQLRFLSVMINKAVEIHWETWNREQVPQEWPKGPDPFDYINLEKNSDQLKEEIGAIWEVILPLGAQSQPVQISTSRFSFIVDRGSWNGSDFFVLFLQ